MIRAVVLLTRSAVAYADTKREKRRHVRNRERVVER